MTNKRDDDKNMTDDEYARLGFQALSQRLGRIPPALPGGDDKATVDDLILAAGAAVFGSGESTGRRPAGEVAATCEVCGAVLGTGQAGEPDALGHVDPTAHRCYPDLEVQLSGSNGNAFAVIGEVSKALKRAGHDPAPFVVVALRQPSYDALIQFIMRTVEVS